LTTRSGTHGQNTLNGDNPPKGGSSMKKMLLVSLDTEAVSASKRTLSKKTMRKIEALQKKVSLGIVRIEA
jgi:hypothetical protein